MSLDRRGEWRRFSRKVERLNDDHGRVQYESEDGEHDRVETLSAADCMRDCEKYFKRFGKNQRGPLEALKDCLKIAHYAQFTFDKLVEELGVNVYEDEDELPDPTELETVFNSGGMEVLVNRSTGVYLAKNSNGSHGCGFTVEDAMNALAQSICESINKANGFDFMK